MLATPAQSNAGQGHIRVDVFDTTESDDKAEELES